MQSKSLLIAIAAFAVATTSVSAYNGTKTAGRNGGLEKEKANAIEEARERCQNDDRIGARDVLVASGISEEDLKLLHTEHKSRQRAIHKAIEDNDYEAFKKAIAGLPLADIVTTKTDFEQFRSAHRYQKELEAKNRHGEQKAFGSSKCGNDLVRSWFGDDYSTPLFSKEQRQALAAARRANDRSTIQAIYDEAGYEHWHKKRAGITGKHR